MYRDERLIVTGITIPSLTAGCLGGLSDGGDDSPPPDSSEFEYETRNIGTDPNRSGSMEFDSIGGIDVFTSPETAFEQLPFDDSNWSERNSAETFIEETSFDQEFLIYVISTWPRYNHTELEFQNIRVSDENVTGTVRAIGDDPDEGDSTPQSPAGLIRASVAGNWPEAVEFTIIDGQDNQVLISHDWDET